MEWMPLLTLKQKDQAILQIQERVSWGRLAATMEGMARASSCVLRMGVRRKQRKAARFLCCQGYHCWLATRAAIDIIISLLAQVPDR